MSSSAGMFRNAFNEVTPARAANLSPACSRVDKEKPLSSSIGSKSPPLCPIALWKRPLVRGDAIRALMAIAPDDWPKTVTLFGSPSKDSIFS